MRNIWIKPQISEKLHKKNKQIPILDTGKAVALQLYKKLVENIQIPYDSHCLNLNIHINITVIGIKSSPPKAR